MILIFKNTLSIHTLVGHPIYQAFRRVKREGKDYFDSTYNII